MAMEKRNDELCDTHNESLYHSQEVLPPLKQAILKNDGATISSSYLSGVGNFCALSG